MDGGFRARVKIKEECPEFGETAWGELSYALPGDFGITIFLLRR